MAMEISTIVLGILGGFVAGVINTVLGSGSVITLSLLGFFGIPLDIANGTNRIGILIHGAKSTYSFNQLGLLKLKGKWLMITMCLVGAIGGTLTAIFISPEQFNFALGLIFCFILLITIFQPQKKLKENKSIEKWIPWLMIPIGFYGGFVQVATGVLLLAILSAILGKSIQESNPLKVFIIMVFNIPAVLLFAWGNKIDWLLGFTLAIGQFVGAIVGVKINATDKNLEPPLRALLIILIVAAIAKFWGVF